MEEVEKEEMEWKKGACKNKRQEGGVGGGGREGGAPWISDYLP